MIKAIDTTYNGYLFRSRLEARWAVFFDRLGLSYQYEPEGFDLASGHYLPDFWLSDDRTYVEVKPHPGPSRVVHHMFSGRQEVPAWRERTLISDLARESGLSACIAYGDPLDALQYKWHDQIFWTSPYASYGANQLMGRLHRDWGASVDAATAARQARFEHGAQA